MNSTMRLAGLLAVALLAALTTAAPARAAATADTLRLLNDARAAHGLAPLRADARLARAARGHSRDMVARHYFAHVSPSGAGLTTRIARTGWMRGRSSWRLAENLAWAGGSSATPAAIVATWLRSPPHRRNILRADLRVVGVGIADGTPSAGQGATYTTDFGSDG
jgi:uncharacterized protein YkwD